MSQVGMFKSQKTSMTQLVNHKVKSSGDWHKSRSLRQLWILGWFGRKSRKDNQFHWSVTDFYNQTVAKIKKVFSSTSTTINGPSSNRRRIFPRSWWKSNSPITYFQVEFSELSIVKCLQKELGRAPCFMSSEMRWLKGFKNSSGRKLQYLFR